MKKIPTYEQIIEGTDPDVIIETKERIDYEWIFQEEEYTIRKRIYKDSGLIKFFKINSTKRKATKEVHKLDDYVMFTKDVLSARNTKRLTHDEVSILYALAERIEWEDNRIFNDNGTLMSIREFADYVSKDKNWVRTILIALESKGFIHIQHGEKRGQSNTICINPKYIWKGRINTRSVTS